MRGYGKSTLARALMRERRRLLVFDTQVEHEALPLEWRGFIDYLDAFFSSAEFPRRQLRVGLIEDGYEAEFCAAAWFAAERLAGDHRAVALTVLLEEADLVAPPGQEPEFSTTLARRGRHRGIELVVCSRRPAEVSRYFTSLAAELYVFRTQEPNDLRYLRSFIGAEATAAISALDKFEYVHWSLAGWQMHRVTPPPGSASASGASKKDFCSAPDNSAMHQRADITSRPATTQGDI